MPRHLWLNILLNLLLMLLFFAFFRFVALYVTIFLLWISLSLFLHLFFVFNVAASFKLQLQPFSCSITLRANLLQFIDHSSSKSTFLAPKKIRMRAKIFGKSPFNTFSSSHVTIHLMPSHVTSDDAKCFYLPRFHSLILDLFYSGGSFIYWAHVTSLTCRANIL